jgi:hypothetical protein
MTDHTNILFVRDVVFHKSLVIVHKQVDNSIITNLQETSMKSLQDTIMNLINSTSDELEEQLD